MMEAPYFCNHCKTVKSTNDPKHCSSCKKWFCGCGGECPGLEGETVGDWYLDAQIARRDFSSIAGAGRWP